MRRRVAFLFPTLWDARQLKASRASWGERYEVVFLGPHDHEVAAGFDVLGFVEQTAREQRGALHGVTTSSDYPGAVAAALLAERLGLPGGEPAAVLTAGHKGESRRLQALAVPEAVPWYRYLDMRDPGHVPEDLPFPCFVKPVRGAFSTLAREVASPMALRGFLAHEAATEHSLKYVAMHRSLQALLAPRAPDPGGFLAEGLLRGTQTTVEGWVQGGQVHLLGVVDSVMFPGTRAFARFETPSALPAAVQARMAEITRRIVLGMGLDGIPFNVELIWDEATDAVRVIELNARLCGQFGDLWQKTQGLNGYEHALALATGAATAPPSAPAPFTYAASVPLRTFEPVVADQVPSPALIAEVEHAFPGTQVWWECRTGEVLAGFDGAGEGQGHRYAVFNVGAHSRKGLLERARAVEQALGARFSPLTTE